MTKYMTKRRLVLQKKSEEGRREHHTSRNRRMGAVMPEPEYDLPLNVKVRQPFMSLQGYQEREMTGEAREGDIFLTESERRTILELKRQYRRFMLVLNVGGPVDLSPVMEVENILILSQLGADRKRSLRILFLGKHIPPAN